MEVSSRIFFLIILNIFGCSVAVDNLLVRLPNGLIQGKDDGYYYSYKSIPYAEPPIGALRFQSPVKYTKKWDILDATKEPSRCLQYDSFTEDDNKIVGAEDCLTVNVYKPKTDKQEKFPVLAVVHGGAFMLGSPSSYKVENIMKNGRVIVANMAYRLGPLGFLSTEDDVISGNFGLKDQRLALQWIKENIEAFGGDANRITVIGFSAGGAAVHLQMLKEDFSNYANAAIAMSGVALDPWVVMRKPSVRAKKLAKYLNCENVENSVQIKKCLQSKPAVEIVRTVPQFMTYGNNPFTTFGPVIEDASVKDAFMTTTPAELIQKGKYAKVPLFVTYSAQDGGYNAGELLSKTKDGMMLIDELNERWLEAAPQRFFIENILQDDTKANIENYALTLKQNYLGDKKFSIENYDVVQQMHTDILFKNYSELAVRWHSANKDIDVYAFVYDNPPDYGIAHVLSGLKDYSFGTVHGDELSLIFPYPARKNVREDEKVISDKLIKMLADFTEDNHNVAYDNCKFETNNGNTEELKLMFITKNKCENKIVTHFP